VRGVFQTAVAHVSATARTRVPPLSNESAQGTFRQARGDCGSVQSEL